MPPTGILVCGGQMSGDCEGYIQVCQRASLWGLSLLSSGFKFGMLRNSLETVSRVKQAQRRVLIHTLKRVVGTRWTPYPLCAAQCVWGLSTAHSFPHRTTYVAKWWCLVGVNWKQEQLSAWPRGCIFSPVNLVIKKPMVINSCFSYYAPFQFSSKPISLFC